MNILLGLFLLGGGTYGGYIFSRRYVERERFYLEAIQFLDSIKPKISFFKKSMLEILQEELCLYVGGFRLLLAQAVEVFSMQGVSEYNKFEEKFKCKFLRENERIYFVQLFSFLGKTDSKSQIESIEAYKNGLQKMHTQCYEEKKKYSSVYQKLGIFVGIAFFIIVI